MKDGHSRPVSPSDFITQPERRRTSEGEEGQHTNVSDGQAQSSTTFDQRARRGIGHVYPGERSGQQSEPEVPIDRDEGSGQLRALEASRGNLRAVTDNSGGHRSDQQVHAPAIDSTGELAESAKLGESPEHPKQLSVPDMIHLLRDKEVANRIVELMKETALDAIERMRNQSGRGQESLEGQALEATAPEDTKGKGKQLDQGDNKAGDSSKQLERLPESQLEGLHGQFARLSGNEYDYRLSQLPKHISVQYESYSIKQWIKESAERGLISQISATEYEKVQDIITDKRLRGVDLTLSDLEHTRKMAAIVAKLQSRRASERIVEEMDDMDLSSEGDVLHQVKMIQGSTNEAIKKLEDGRRGKLS